MSLTPRWYRIPAPQHSPIMPAGTPLTPPTENQTEAEIRQAKRVKPSVPRACDSELTRTRFPKQV